MSAWTPGPWQIERFGNAWVTAIRSQDRRAVCYGSIDDADALLIAAAPELAEALIATTRELRLCRDQLASTGRHSHADGSVNSALEKARAALAKAGVK